MGSLPRGNVRAVSSLLGMRVSHQLGEMPMSEVVQRRKGLKPKQLMCTNTHCYPTRELAKEYIERRKNKGIRGSSTLEVFRCLIHSSKQGDVYHVRQRRRNR